jgi:hypothetical protein
MTSVDPTLTTTLLANVRRLGLTHTAESLDDLIARATRSRWSPTILLDTLVQAELEARARRRLERQLQAARLAASNPSPTSNGRGPSSWIGRPSTGSSRSTSSRRARTSSWSPPKDSARPC